ncbi:hypothetical protein OQA88_6138 [Cercophora sp. LCS_1]
MLSYISGKHDAHYIRQRANSLQNVTAARSETYSKHILLAIWLIPEIVKALAKYEGRISIRIVLTSSARQFLNGQSDEQPTVSALLHLPNVDAVYDDADEWGPQPWKRGASILHIELRRWADILVVAPLSANTLAKYHLITTNTFGARSSTA